MCSSIESMVSILQQSPLLILDFVRHLRLLGPGDFTLCAARKYVVNLWSWIFLFLREFRKHLHKFFVRETIVCVHAFTVIAHTMMADLLTINPLSSFDTDSSF